MGHVTSPNMEHMTPPDHGKCDPPPNPLGHATLKKRNKGPLLVVNP